MKILSTERKLALKISLIAFLVLIFIMGGVIVSSFAYGWNRAFDEFNREQRMLDEKHIANEILSEKIINIKTDELAWTWHEKKLFPWIWPRKWPRDIIIYDKNRTILRNEVLEMTDNLQEALFSIPENKLENLILWDRHFLTVKKEIGSYTIFLLHDIKPIMEYYENLITIALIGSIIGFLIIFIMANHLAKITIEPIREHNKELGSYSHNVAHELRTPLTVIRQNLELLQIKPTEKLIHSTDEEITWMEQIIETLLFLAKPKAQWLKSEIIELPHFLREILEPYKKDIHYIEPKKTLKKSLHKELLKRVIDNLVQNALKYKKDWLVEVRFTNDTLSIKNSIERNFTEKELSEVTKAFYQADTSRSSSGYWLWLALVKKIVELEWWKMNIRTIKQEFIVDITFSL